MQQLGFGLASFNVPASDITATVLSIGKDHSPAQSDRVVVFGRPGCL